MTAVLETWSDWSRVSVRKDQVQRRGAVCFCNSFSPLPVVTELLSPYTPINIHKHIYKLLFQPQCQKKTERKKSCVCFYHGGIHLYCCSIQQLFAFQYCSESGVLYSMVDGIFTPVIYFIICTLFSFWETFT